MAGNLNVSVKHNLREVAAQFSVNSKKLIEASAIRALNRTATTVRADAVKLMRQRYTLKAAAIRRQMKIVRAGRGRLTSEVRISGRRIPLIEFAARQVKRGVTVNVTRERKLVRGVFIAKMPSGHVGVFERQNKARLPIRQLFTISLPQAFTQRNITASLKRIAAERFDTVLKQELKFRTGR